MFNIKGVVVSRPKPNLNQVAVKHYFYPNLYYLIGVYALVALIAALFWPFEASFESVSSVAIVSLSVLAVSIVAGPITNAQTIENKWLKDAAASSFVTTFAMLAVGSSLALFNIINWQLANFAVIAVASIDFLAKLIVAKRRES